MKLFSRWKAAAAAAALALITGPALAQRIEIQWWHAMSGVLAERLEEAAKQFNDSQQKYTVVPAAKGNYDEILNAVIAAYRAKRPPHIVQVAERGFMTMLLSDAVVPVHELMAKNGYNIDWGDFIKPVAGFYMHKGKLTAMPFNSSSPILWFNKEHFKKAGLDKPAETWGEFEKQLYQIKSSGVSSCAIALPGDYFWSMIENYSAINDEPFATKANGYDGLDAEFVYNKGLVVKQMTRLKKWLDDGVLQIAGQGVNPESLFINGQCSTIMASTAAHGGVERSAKFDWSATYLPWEEGRAPRNSTIGGASLWVMKGHKDEEYAGAAAFLNFVSSPQFGLWWHKVTGYVPLTNKAYQLAKQEGYYEKSPTREIAILQLNRGTPTPNSQGFHFGNHVQTTFALREEVEQIWTGKKSVQQALDDAVKRGNDILRQYEKLNAGKY